MFWMEYFDPFEYAERLRKRMERMLREIFSEDLFEALKERAGIPKMDFLEKEDKYIILLDLPGVKKEDIDLRVLRDRIILRAKVSQEEEVRKENIYKKERRYEEYYRVIPLPPDANPDDVKARYENGVLKIEIGKRERVEGRKVEVE